MIIHRGQMDRRTYRQLDKIHRNIVMIALFEESQHEHTQNTAQFISAKPAFKNHDKQLYIRFMFSSPF